MRVKIANYEVMNIDSQNDAHHTKTIIRFNIFSKDDLIKELIEAKVIESTITHNDIYYNWFADGQYIVVNTNTDELICQLWEVKKLNIN